MMTMMMMMTWKGTFQDFFFAHSHCNATVNVHTDMAEGQLYANHV